MHLQSPPPHTNQSFISCISHLLDNQQGSMPCVTQLPRPVPSHVPPLPSSPEVPKSMHLSQPMSAMKQPLMVGQLCCRYTIIPSFYRPRYGSTSSLRSLPHVQCLEPTRYCASRTITVKASLPPIHRSAHPPSPSATPRESLVDRKSTDEMSQ